MIQLARVVLGPSLRTRDYGVIAATHDAPTDPILVGVLTNFILEARKATVPPGKHAAFFPLEKSEGSLWALCLIERGADGITYADAAIFSRALLDQIGWRAHRVLKPWPVSAAHAAEPVVLDPAIFASGDARGEREARMLHRVLQSEGGKAVVYAHGGPSPMGAVHAIWEAMPASGRVNLSFCTTREIADLVTGATGRKFNIVTAVYDPAQVDASVEPIILDKGGLRVPASRLPGWWSGFTRFRGNFQKQLQLTTALPELDESQADPAGAFRELLAFALNSFARDQAANVLSCAAIAGSDLEPPLKSVLANLIDEEFQKFLVTNPADRVNAIGLYFEHVTTHLKTPPTQLARLAIEHRILFALPDDAFEDLAGRVLDVPAFTRSAAEQTLAPDAGKRQLHLLGRAAVVRLDSLDSANPNRTPQQNASREEWINLLCRIIEAFGSRADTRTSDGEAIHLLARALVVRQRRRDLARVITLLEGRDAAWRKVSTPADIRTYNAARDARRARPTANPAQICFDAMRSAIESLDQGISIESLELELPLVVAR